MKTIRYRNLYTIFIRYFDKKEMIEKGNPVMGELWGIYLDREEALKHIDDIKEEEGLFKVCYVYESASVIPELHNWRYYNGLETSGEMSIEDLAKWLKFCVQRMSRDILKAYEIYRKII